MSVSDDRPDPARRMLRVVCADDEPDMREFLSRILVHFGHDVVSVVGNGEDLITMTLQTRPDLVIADVRMPRMDGLQALQKIREMIVVPSIIVSAHFSDEIYQQAIALGTVAWLIKPIGRTELEVALRNSDIPHRSESEGRISGEDFDVRNWPGH